MELKMKVVTYNEIDYYDFNKFVQSIYGGNFEFVANEEANNYSRYKFDAPNVHMDFDGEEEAAIRSGKYPMQCTHALFNVLHKDGHIQAGDYIIKVSW
jgi:hypothetical protein